MERRRKLLCQRREKWKGGGAKESAKKELSVKRNSREVRIRKLRQAHRKKWEATQNIHRRKYIIWDRPLWWLLYPGRGSDAYKMSKVQLTLLSQTTIAAREGRATHSPAFARRFIVLLHRWRHYRQTLNADGRCPLREKKVDGWKREWHRSNKTNVHV